jgi:hypothetical protein
MTMTLPNQVIDARTMMFDASDGSRSNRYTIVYLETSFIDGLIGDRRYKCRCMPDDPSTVKDFGYFGEISRGEDGFPSLGEVIEFNDLPDHVKLAVMGDIIAIDHDIRAELIDALERQHERKTAWVIDRYKPFHSIA